MSQETKAQRILVADDTDFFRTMLTHVLSEDSYQVDTVDGGAAALERLMEDPKRYQMLVADLLMPGLNGFQLVEQLRKETQLAELPVLVLTQYGLNELERGILKSHRAGTLSKSASFGQILSAVAALLRPGSTDLRRHWRAPVSLPLTVRAEGKVHVTECFNVSEEGLFIVVSDAESPAPGTEVLIRFWVPEAEQVMEVKARVAWVNRPGSLETSHPPGFGVQLLEPDEAVRGALKGYLDSQGH